MINIKIENNDFDNFNEYIKENKINIEEIEKIELIKCKKIKNLPKINNLKELIINECDNLELPIECVNLEKLTIYEKDNLKDFGVDVEKYSSIYNRCFDNDKQCFDENKKRCEEDKKPKMIKLQLDYPHIKIIPEVFINLKELILYNSSINYISNNLVNLEKITLNYSYIDLVSLAKLPNLNYLKINSIIEDLIFDNKELVVNYLKFRLINEIMNNNKCFTIDPNEIKLLSLINHKKTLERCLNNNFTLCYCDNI